MSMIGNSLEDKLQLQEPMSIDGPFPHLARMADVGDLLQLQIYSVPGPDASPVSVRAFSQHGCSAFVEAVTTGGAVYRPRPGETITGVLGTTNYSIFVKAVRPGNHNRYRVGCAGELS
jgi:hypothetical protein